MIERENLAVQEGRNKKQFHDLERLAPGIYLVVLQDADNQRQVFKIQKSN